MFYPHMRGSSQKIKIYLIIYHVLPAYAGMIPAESISFIIY